MINLKSQDKNISVSFQYGKPVEEIYSEDTKVYGRNLVINSRTHLPLSNDSKLYPMDSKLMYDEDDLYIRTMRTDTELNPTLFSLYRVSVLSRQLPKNTTITASMFVRLQKPKKAALSFGVLYAGGVQEALIPPETIDVGTEWQLITLTGTVKNIEDRIITGILFYLGTVSGLEIGDIETFYLDTKNVKIELGSVRTPYTQAPEDRSKIVANINSIGKSIENKNPNFKSVAPLAEWSKAIDEIDGWRQKNDWWDIKKILTDDKTIDVQTGLPFAYKWVELIRDKFGSENTDTVSVSGDSAYIYSDNPKVLVTTEQPYTFDKTKDKVCSEGYSTRYIIHFRKNALLGNTSKLALWWVANYEVTGLGSNTFANRTILEAVEFIDGKTFNSNSYIELFSDCYKLTKIPSVIKTDNCVNARHMFAYCGNLKNGCDFTDVSKITNLESFMAKCEFKYFPRFTGKLNPKSWYQCFYFTNVNFREDFEYNIDFEGCTSLRNFGGYTSFNRLPWLIDATTCDSYGCVNLMSPVNYGITNLKIKGLKATNNYSLLNSWEKDCLLYTITHLATVTSATLTIGASNLKKLTAEEIAIGTSKGWVIN